MPKDQRERALEEREFMEGLEGAEVTQQPENPDSDAEAALPGQPEASTGRDAEFYRRAVKEWGDFFKRHPEIRPQELNDEMLEGYLAGMSPAELWLERRLDELEKACSELKRRDAAEKKAVGSAASETGEQQEDEFLAGLFED